MKKKTTTSEAARILGRLGGKARAQSQTPAERVALAKLAIAARWRRKKEKQAR